jgi:predicted alpha/beta-hydrolase family hydrolase
LKQFEGKLFQGWLHQPEAHEQAPALAITHGAGSNCQSPFLRAVAESFCAGGFYVLRYNLPYRIARPTGPPPPGSATSDREAIAEAAAAMRELTSGPLLVGGHSYGGRQSSMLASEQPGVADMLLLLSYPLHPPRRPEQLRTAHFSAITTPALFIHGSRDSFGSLEEMAAALALIPAPHTLFAAEKAGHELGPAWAPAILREAQCFANELKK